MSIPKLVKLGMAAARSNFGVLELPYKLNFCITYRCQSRCQTCSIWRMRPEGELSLAEIRQFAKRNPFFRWIQLTGGEPFLHKDIVEIVTSFQETSKGLYVVTIPTNSLCRREVVVEKVQAILASGLPRLSITISLDGYRELHDYIRGVPGNYDKAIALYQELEQLRQSHKNLALFLGYTMCKYNAGQLQQTFDAVSRDLPFVTANRFHVNLAQYSDVYYRNGGSDLAADCKMAAGELRAMLAQRRFEMGAISMIERAFLTNLLRYLESGTTPVKSRSLDASLFLDSFGDVYPSIMWDKKIGNIRDTGYELEPLWRSDSADEARRLMAEGQEPSSWTACEAHQALVGDVKQLIV